eukprot:1157663-Pelagomonas_calceolata.AAC.2
MAAPPAVLLMLLPLLSLMHLLLVGWASEAQSGSPPPALLLALHAAGAGGWSVEAGGCALPASGPGGRPPQVGPAGGGWRSLLVSEVTLEHVCASKCLRRFQCLTFLCAAQPRNALPEMLEGAGSLG